MPVTFLEAAKTMVSGLWGLLRRILLTLGILGAIGLLGFALALPLWAFSVFRPHIYTLFALAVLTGGIVLLVARRIARRCRQEGGFGAWARLRVLPALRAAALVAAFAAAAYAALVFFARGLIAAGVLVSAAVVLLGGYLRFVRRRRSERS